ncbi:MAG: hypothetical protein CSYNP_00236 [Syntrophus sp. SKADARSKE-3]|nr:hypothetical protein [Syntrophus sp. SKADARSKE-3]
MKDTILMANGKIFKEIPLKDWKDGLTAVVGQVVDGLIFMTQEHHRVRNFAVRELPRVGLPLTTKFIAESLNLKATRTKVILDELEKHMTFLFRNGQGDVAWAYPVTVDPTPHRVHFSTGESMYAA